MRTLSASLIGIAIAFVSLFSSRESEINAIELGSNDSKQKCLYHKIDSISPGSYPGRGQRGNLRNLAGRAIIASRGPSIIHNTDCVRDARGCC